MAHETATTTYWILEPFDKAVAGVRKALSMGNFRVTGELDMAARIERRLLIQTAPCLILFVGPANALGEGNVGDPRVAALTPLHVVVSARGTHTEIHILRVPPGDASPDGAAPQGLGRFQADVARALEKIGMREPLCC